MGGAGLADLDRRPAGSLGAACLNEIPYLLLPPPFAVEVDLLPPGGVVGVVAPDMMTEIRHLLRDGTLAAPSQPSRRQNPAKRHMSETPRPPRGPDHLVVSRQTATGKLFGVFDAAD